MSFANITVVGRLAKDPEVRMTSTGKEIVTGNIAVGTKDKTQWFKVQAWEKVGLWLKDAKKGDLVFAQGTLQIGTYEKKTGGVAIDAQVNAQVVRTSHKREDVGDDYSAQQPRQASNEMPDLEDLPF